MTNRNHKLEELRQRMEVMVSTFFMMNGYMPDIDEMYEALGDEFLPVLGSNGDVPFVA